MTGLLLRALVTRNRWLLARPTARGTSLAPPAGFRWFRAGRSRSFLERACHADRLVLGSSGSSRHWSRSSARAGPLVSAGSARAGPQVSLRSSGRTTGLRWFSSGRATGLTPQLGSGHWSPLAQLGPGHWSRSAARAGHWSCSAARVGPLVSAGSARAGPLVSFRSSGRATGLRWFSLGRATGLAPQLGSGHWSPLAGLRCVRLSHSSVSWSLARRSCTLVSAAHFFSAARSPASANSTGIWLLSSVPHLWSSSFDCPASQVKKNQAHLLNREPLSWFCVSDLLC
jgi:hypothetical protein